MVKALIAALFTVISVSPGTAQELRAVAQMRSSGPVTSPTSQNIVSSLRALMTDFAADGFTKDTAGRGRAAQRFSSAMRRVDDAGRVQVYVALSDTTAATLDVLRGHGLDIELVNDDFRIVQGWVAIDDIETIAGDPGVLKIRPPSYGSRNAGAVTTQGDSIHRCDQARALGFRGGGIKVGVVSGGVSGLAAAQGAGELPAVEVLSNDATDDEGTAILEIVHDCAPDATLGFASVSASGVITSLGFIDAVNRLRGAGAQIIVDDVGFLSEPYFEDGLNAQNDRAVGRTVLRVSAAGNLGRGHYQGQFTPAFTDSQTTGVRHNFFAGDTLLRFRVPAGSAAVIVLQWSNRFGSAADDYDLCVRQVNGLLVACSLDFQTGNDDPLEAVQVQCSGPAVCAGDIQITRFAGASQMLQLFCIACVFDEFNMKAGSILGHQSVPEVLAVAAVNASASGAVESYSSAGPSTILFPAPGEVRFKPDIAAADCVATSRPGFDPFCGTSAAAPHVAGVAALLMEALGPGAPVGTVRQILKVTAANLGPSGADFDSGFGLVDAVAAVQSRPLPPRSADYDGDDRADLAVWRPSIGTWYVIGSSGNSVRAQEWGAAGDIPAPGDYDGDARTDLAVWRPSTGTWYVMSSSTGVRVQQWGADGDVPAPGDYEGDGRTDFAVWRPSTGTWYVLTSSGGVLIEQWGQSGDVPVPGDYDADRRTDIAVWRPSTGTWYVIESSTRAVRAVSWGLPDDIPVRADFEGDGKTDIAVWRPSTGTWFIRYSSGSVRVQQWGAPGDQPLPGRP